MTYEKVKEIRSNPTADDVDNKELARLIDEAIEKQIPKKPVFKDDGYDYYRSINIYGIYCPTCKELVLGYTDNELTDDCDGILEKDFFKSKEIDFSEIRKHNCCCSCCGQALDWSDE